MAIFDDSRAAWRAASNTNPRSVPAAARVGISWHHDGGSPLNLAGKPHAACLTRVHDDQAFHMSPARGWADIGYNLLVCPHGRVIEGRGIDLQGAHSPGVNFEHYGVQFMVGGSEDPTPAAYARAQRLANDLAAHSGHSLRQWGHKDDPAASTECPGTGIESWVKRQGAASPSPTSTPTPDLAQGGLTMADINDILAKLDQVNGNVSGLRSEEAGRYVTASNRNGQVVGLLKSIAGKVGANVDVDEAAIATELLKGLAPQVADAVKAAVAAQPAAGAVNADELAAAVVAQLGAKLT